MIDRDGWMDMEMDGYIYYIYGCEGRGRRRDSGDLGRRGGRIGGWADRGIGGERGGGRFGRGDGAGGCMVGEDGIWLGDGNGMEMEWEWKVEWREEWVEMVDIYMAMEGVGRGYIWGGDGATD